MTNEVLISQVSSCRRRLNPQNLAGRKIKFDERSNRDTRRPILQPRDWIGENSRRRWRTHLRLRPANSYIDTLPCTLEQGSQGAGIETRAAHQEPLRAENRVPRHVRYKFLSVATFAARFHSSRPSVRGVTFRYEHHRDVTERWRRKIDDIDLSCRGGSGARLRPRDAHRR
jgi:hypothetical protein